MTCSSSINQCSAFIGTFHSILFQLIKSKIDEKPAAYLLTLSTSKGQQIHNDSWASYWYRRPEADERANGE
jgi:hypothetical protein